VWKMASSLHTFRYKIFRKLIVEARLEAKVRQIDLAEGLEKPQSFVSKYERGERRLDFIEFIAIAEAINLDVHDFIERYTGEVAVQEIRYLPRDASD